MKSLATMIVGFLLGISAVLACNDDWPPRVDAATACDCPAAEPPIASRIVETIRSITLPPSSENNGRNGGGFGCPDNSILLTGGCTAGIGQVPDIVIEQNSPTPITPTNRGNSWNCSWRNNTNQPVEARIIVRCLMAAP